MATRLPMWTFSASYTAAMPPRPISRVMRYLPARTVPTGIFDLFGRAIRTPLGGEPIRGRRRLQCDPGAPPDNLAGSGGGLPDGGLGDDCRAADLWPPAETFPKRPPTPGD